jgi:putative membrane protein
MFRMILKIAVYALAIWLAVRLIDGLSFDGTAWALLGIAVILAIVNAVVKPIVKVLSFPVVLVTLGLFLLVINALMLWLTVRISDALDLGLASDGFGATFLGALVISIVVWIGEAVTDRG